MLRQSPLVLVFDPAPILDVLCDPLIWRFPSRGCHKSAYVTLCDTTRVEIRTWAMHVPARGTNVSWSRSRLCFSAFLRAHGPWCCVHCGMLPMLYLMEPNPCVFCLACG